MNKIKKETEKIRRLYLENDVFPFPDDGLRKLREDLGVEFEKQAGNEIISADLNTYWMFIAGLASGSIKTILTDAWERYQLRTKLEKSFFDWFPQYRFLEPFDLSEYKDLDRDLKLYDKLRLMLLEVINLYENKKN